MIRPSRTQCWLPPSSMSLTCPGPVARQHNCDKSSVQLRQNQYHSKVHTPLDKRGASAKGNPPPDNHQSPQVSQDKKNGKNTPNSDSSITPALLWPRLIENPVVLPVKNLASLTANTWEALQFVRWHPNSGGCIPVLQSDETCSH